MSRSWQRNAADPRQVGRAEKQELDAAARRRGRLRAVLQTVDGRAVLWDLVVRAGVFASIYDQSARIHYNAGRQDFGHELLAAVIDADEAAYLVMEQEARERQRREDRDADAAPRARGDDQE
jgi:hypothetical protein